MEFDQTYNSAADWSFPSPGATPTAGNFNQTNAFQTPKTATFPSHFFQDAFGTPQMPGYATPRQPEYATMTPLQRPAETIPSNDYGNINSTQGVMVNGRPGMPPPSHAGHQGPVLSPVYSNAPVQASQPGTALSFDTSQMQTPPPTRGTSAKKLTHQQVAFGTPSTIASRRFVTPQQAVPMTQHHQAPMQFPHLQLSPNVFEFGNLGPASAPVFPQTQLLWEQTTSPTNYSNQQQMLDDPFAPAVSQSMQWPAAPVHQHQAHSMSFNTPATSGLSIQVSQAPIQRPASAAPVASAQPHLSPPVMTSAGVDPSLVYSSPIRPVMPSNTPQSKPRVTKARSESRRKDGSRTEHQRTSSADSISATVPPKELQRSSTTGQTRPLDVVSSTPAEPLSRRNSLLQPPRTGSPLKRVGKVPMGSISESKPRPRPSVVLTVDETGRARTETQHQEPSPTQSIRDRYPGLFDSDSSDDDSEDEDETPSRSTSFSFAKREERRSKAVKLDPPVENLQGLSLPQSSSSASMKVAPSRAAIAAAAQLRRGGSLRKQTPSRNGSRRIASSTTASIDTAPMDISFERLQTTFGARQDAQELDWSGSTLDAHNRRWSLMSQEQQQSVSPTHPFPENSYQQPPYQHQYQQPRKIRCSCGVTHDRGQPLVQCHSCTQWSHAACINPHSAALPHTFTCFLCTIPTAGLQIKPGSRRR